MSVTIYHNPRCSKSRKTLEIVEQSGHPVNVVDYLVTPPSVEDLRQILDMLGKKPREILRKKEAKEAGLDDPNLSDEALISGMVANPIAIERPIVIREMQARIGRPPESVLEIL